MACLSNHLRAHNDRNEQGYRAYANGYEPSVDVWLRWLRALYRQHEPLAVTLGTVPHGKDLAAMVTFDVDYVQSRTPLPKPPWSAARTTSKARASTPSSR
ncbi:hypothetical protein HKW98_04795 [Stutzerimonas urumqiensis]|uniref:hypothetical protein n=1 Tax=Stutzerimonas urumqiensis TaxID=638269 RepID=UPI003BA8E819